MKEKWHDTEEHKRAIEEHKRAMYNECRDHYHQYLKAWDEIRP